MKEGGKGYEEEEDRWSREGRVRHGMCGLLAEELLMEAKVSCFLLLLLHVSICCLFLFVWRSLVFWYGCLCMDERRAPIDRWIMWAQPACLLSLSLSRAVRWGATWCYIEAWDLSSFYQRLLHFLSPPAFVCVHELCAFVKDCDSCSVLVLWMSVLISVIQLPSLTSAFVIAVHSRSTVHCLCCCCCCCWA